MQSFIIVGQTVPEIHEEKQILSFELQLCQKTVKEGKREAWAGFLVEANLVY